MRYETGYYYARQYKYAGINQHGERFKVAPSKQIIVAKLSCDCSDADELKQLVLLSDRLQVPIRYNFEKQLAYIELMSADTVRRDK